MRDCIKQQGKGFFLSLGMRHALKFGHMCVFTSSIPVNRFTHLGVVKETRFAADFFSMTDYSSEQAMEIEALEAILMDDLEIFSGTQPDGWSAVGETYKVLIDPTEEGDEPPPPEEEKLAELIFAHTAQYPGRQAWCQSGMIMMLMVNILAMHPFFRVPIAMHPSDTGTGA